MGSWEGERGIDNFNKVQAMNEAVLVGIGVLLGGVVAWVFGRRAGARAGAVAASQKAREELSGFLKALREGTLSGGGPAGGGADSSFRELREILARDWVPKGKEGAEAIRKALGRLTIYLHNRVESPLLEGLDKGGQALQDSADEALGAVEDLEFFLEAPDPSPELGAANLVEMAQEVVQEFAAQSPVEVKVVAPQDAIPVRVNAEGLKDAIFLILHNAAEFGGGVPVELTLRREGPRAVLRIRDRGPGFSSEALMQALDPFYSTSPAGLGMGLPHARSAVKAQGGEILLRNPDGGGGEVEILLPGAH